MINHLKTPYFAVIVSTIILAISPFFIDSYYILSVLTLANLYAVFATSWDLVSGYTGNLILGQALFIGIGGFTVGIFHDSLGFILSIILGVIFCMIAAFVVGGPSLKIRGPYFSLITMVLPLIMYQLVYTFRNITGGEYGLSVNHSISRQELFYITLAYMFISVMILLFISRSKIGKIFIAIREDEYGCAALGNNVTFYKLLAFNISAVLSGIGGGLLAIYLRHIGPNVFDLWLSVTILIIGIVGGIGTIIGPFFAAYILTFLPEVLRSTEQYQDLIFALILILSVFFLPNGFIRFIDRFKNRKVEEVSPQESVQTEERKIV